MRNALLSAFIGVFAFFLTSCGNSSKPLVQPQTSSFAFMQEAGGSLFTPMLGNFSTSGTTTTIRIGPILDPSTNQPVTGDFYSIVLSPDGTKAAVDLFGGQNGDTSRWDIFLADSGGRGDLLPVTTDAYADAMPQFSPDGRKVVFNSQRPGLSGSDQWQIVIRSIGSTGELVLPMPLGADQTWAPTYSPDGSKIAVEAWGYDALGNYFDGIVTMKTDGSAAQLLTNPSASCDCFDENPSFTADGTKIVFSRDAWDSSTATESEDIYIMNANGSGVRKLTSGSGISFDPMAVNIPGVGPSILFSSNWDHPGLTGPGGFEVYMMNLDGTDVTQLTTNMLYDGFSSERYDSGTVSAQREQRVPLPDHQLPQGHSFGHKVKW